MMALAPHRARELRDLVALIDERRVAKCDGRLVLAELTDRFAARHRFAHGAYELRIAGVTSTSTAGAAGLLTNWQAAARRRLAKDRDHA